jgi:hypothetical protein
MSEREKEQTSVKKAHTFPNKSITYIKENMKTNRNPCVFKEHNGSYKPKALADRVLLWSIYQNPEVST